MHNALSARNVQRGTAWGKSPVTGLEALHIHNYNNLSATNRMYCTNCHMHKNKYIIINMEECAARLTVMVNVAFIIHNSAI